MKKSLDMYANNEPNESDLKLELVQVFFRHGARNPTQNELKAYQFNDKPAYANRDIEQLNDVGKRQMYELGLFLKEQYKNFLTENYVSEEVYAFSSGTDRTKMSLELVLAGFYPPMGHEVWNPNLMWLPIPYNYVPTEFDILIFSTYNYSKFRKLRVEAYQTTEFREKVAGYSDFIKFLTANTNYDFNDFFNFLHLYTLLQEQMDLPMPRWYRTEMKEKLKDLAGLVYDGYVFTLEMKKLGAGSLIKTFIENMNLKRTNVNPRKIYLYSGHEFNIASFTRAHNIEEFRCPDLGCSLIFEKLRDSNDQVYVRLFGRTGSGNLVPLKLGNNKEFCPIDEYLKFVESIIPSENEFDEMFEEVLGNANLKNIFFSDPVVKKSPNK